MIDIERLKDLFTRYEYEILKVQEGKYAVFSSGSSMYPAVEIVKLSENDDDEINKLKKEYSEASYAVRICSENNIEDIEHYLFNWFFQVKETNSRIKAKYKEYTESIMRAYAFQGSDIENRKYQYINIPYSLERNFFETTSSSTGLVNSIREDLKKEGPQLIILEAGAGFGKTSTVYEILNDYKDVESNVRPFFMELAKDRIAPTFHYLLLSQIDKNFKVRLGSDIVLYNIKRGYIPLLIDGFDELLSKDLDNGKMDTKFSKVETMLSTIADLLTDNAKVILTTRKTAIFAGENFYDWYETLQKQGRNFEISRYQLGSPSIHDWLQPDRIKLLPTNFDKISNPVILGYMRYLNDEEFEKTVKSNSLTLCYLSSILKREIERQDLPFNIEEQKQALRRLAAYFAGINSTALPRSDVKDTIKDTSSELLKMHSTPEKDVKSLSNALTNHAFLDRKSDENIGFLNDFILGTFLMYSIKDETDEFFLDCFKDATFSFIEKTILAASVYDIPTKKDFGNKLIERCSLNPILLFWCDTLLFDKTIHDFEGISFDGRNLKDVSIGDEKSNISKCCFSNIKFTECVFDFNYIKDCSFINCEFESCYKEGENYDCGFYSCKQQGDVEFIDKIETKEIVEEVDKNDKDHMLELLRLYFQVDERTQRMRMISRIKDKFDTQIFKRIFGDAVTQGYIITNGDKSFITKFGRDYINSNK